MDRAKDQELELKLEFRLMGRVEQSTSYFWSLEL
jgi:hypothetical protein